jgi:hypothetical protein
MASYFLRKKGKSLTIYRQEFTAGKKAQKYIPKHLWPSLGVSPTADEGQIRDAIKRLNQDGKLKREAQARESSLRRLNESKIVESVFLPKELVLEFEEEFKLKSFGSDAHVAKLLSHWVTIQELISELRIEPAEYSVKRHLIYRAMAKRKYSPSYVQRLVRILNEWGRFVSRNRGTFFESVPSPRGQALTLVNDRYQESELNRSGGSTPLTAATIEKLKGKIAPDQLNWLELSFYFGLRPIEVEGLRSKKTRRIETDTHEIPILHVFQSKLRHHSNQAWKAIPCILPKQRELLILIEEGNFRRPLAKTIQSYAKDERLTLYGGRKGFTDLMLENGQLLEDVSQWLGHSEIDRTWSNYKNKNRISWSPVKKRSA